MYPSECKEAFTDAQIASTVPPAAFDAFAQCRLTLLEVKLSSEMERQKKAEVKRELEKLMQMDEQQRRVYAKKREVCDLLTDACPRCKQAFFDFNGCCALVCSRCPCGFCAWCLEDCGTDAHRHVANCRHNLAPGRNLFASEGAWKEGRIRIKRDAVTRFLRGLDAKLAKEVARAVERELRDVGLGDVAALFNK
jgi:hypothetical protein